MRAGTRLRADWEQHTYGQEPENAASETRSQFMVITDRPFQRQNKYYPVLYSCIYSITISCSLTTAVLGLGRFCWVGFFFPLAKHILPSFINSPRVVSFFYFFQEPVFLGGREAKQMATFAFSFRAIISLTRALSNGKISFK